jgi:hypothetical protein
MPLAQVLQFDQRQAMGRQRKVQPGSNCVILQLFRAPMHRTDVSTGTPSPLDSDGFPGRGRDPG